MTDDLTPSRILVAYERARDDLLAERNDRGHWTGKLSTSALSTATAVMALEQVRRHSSPIAPHSSLITGGLAWLAAHQNDDGGWGDTTKSFSNISTTMLCHAVFHVTRELWDPACATAVPAVRRANTPTTDGTSDTAVAHEYQQIVDRAKAYIDHAGGVPALIARYGNDKTFSGPILTHCALAGLVDWREVQQLPFELACLPARFYKTVRLPVVSYALPALIAIGQVRHHFRPTRVPGLRWLRNRAKRKSLDVLQRIQPAGGGFLEATPLTSFVTMSLAGMGLVDHPVVKQGVDFIVNSVRDDGSWPIDTNLATWVTTLSVNALGPDLPDDAREPILRWLLDQQYNEVHSYTNADPGGWSWTDLPGGVPDADDTAGAILAILELVTNQESGDISREATPSAEHGDTDDSRLQFRSATGGWGRADRRAPSTKSDNTLGAPVGRPQPPPLPEELVADAHEAVRRAVKWLLDLQNRDGGWPTFCRGWGKLPFDRSSPDITAHCLRALSAVHTLGTGNALTAMMKRDDPIGTHESIERDAGGFPLRRIPNSQFLGFQYLESSRLDDAMWSPLWFGNQHAEGELNISYGTARVLVAFRDGYGEINDHKSRPSMSSLRDIQNADGGWGGDKGCPSTVEETALAVEVLLSDPSESSQLAARRGLLWLIDRVEDGTYREPTPIGFYFAKLWYFERLYPLIFTVAALRRACEVLADTDDA